MVDGGERVVIAHAVQTVGGVVVMRCLCLSVPVLQPALRMGGEVAAVVGEGFGKLTLCVVQPPAQPVVGVGAFPVVGQTTVNFCVVTNKVVVKANRLLTGGMDYPRPDGRG